MTLLITTFVSYTHYLPLLSTACSTLNILQYINPIWNPHLPYPNTLLPPPPHFPPMFDLKQFLYTADSLPPSPSVFQTCGVLSVLSQQHVRNLLTSNEQILPLALIFVRFCNHVLKNMRRRKTHSGLPICMPFLSYKSSWHKSPILCHSINLKGQSGEVHYLRF
jgi:hypothetical protein